MGAALKKDTVLLKRYVERAAADLPALPQVVLQVVKKAEEPNCRAMELSQLIEHDPGLSTKILKVVNSAYFGLPRSIKTIHNALVILGINQVRNLTLSMGVLNVLSSPNPRIRDHQKAFWEQSFGAARAAQLVASKKRLSREEQEGIFVGGLLHDIGRLFYLTLFNLPYQQVIDRVERSEVTLSQVERSVLGASHPEIGGDLAKRWGFPESLIRMIRSHEGDFSSGRPHAEYCVHIADSISTWVEREGQTEPNLQAEASDWAGLTQDEFEEIRVDMEGAIARSREILQIG